MNTAEIRDTTLLLDSKLKQLWGESVNAVFAAPLTTPWDAAPLLKKLVSVAEVLNLCLYSSQTIRERLAGCEALQAHEKET